MLNSLVHEPASPCCGLIYAAGGKWYCGSGRMYDTAEGAAQALVDDCRARLASADAVLRAVRGLRNEHVAAWIATSTSGGERATQPTALHDDAPADLVARFTLSDIETAQH